MLDTLSSQYDSFLYWKLPIPELDLSELECLGLDDTKKHRTMTSIDQKNEEEDDHLTQYNAFNFWRAPIASIDTLDFDLF
ncbi:protein AF1q [Bombina bombina]|uniref:protein AF1q n=1 Tax=Bombina bombina TaxID=8345 RepID=UPI00235AF20D|nr:protein AF1q [Bombina bombina]